MTAFARTEHGTAVWELRSVNHRYLDISFRMPENFRHLESLLKSRLKDRVHRGKLECSLRINTNEVTTGFELNTRLIQDLGEAIKNVQAITGIESSGDAISLLRWPDVLTPEDNSEIIRGDVTAGFETAVTALVEMRAREGAMLADLITQRLDDIEATLAILREETPAILAAQHEKLRRRLAELDVEVDPSRLEQELVTLAQKLDITEEMDRLGTHVTEVRRNLTQDEPVGRRLDFLMQELNREANTLSSKASASITTLKAVDLKVNIEQMREQIQNIE